MFEPGQKVVCVDDIFPRAVLNYMRSLPEKGKTYTVRDIIPAQDWDGRDTCAVLLAEVRNPPAPHRKQWGECGFSPERFRAVEDLAAVNYTVASVTYP